MTSFICLDCKIDTQQIGEYYMIDDRLWRAINPSSRGMLCIGCVEARLGRELTRGDFTDCQLSYDIHRSDRLNLRLHGATREALLLRTGGVRYVYNCYTGEDVVANEVPAGRCSHGPFPDPRTRYDDFLDVVLGDGPRWRWRR